MKTYCRLLVLVVLGIHSVAADDAKPPAREFELPKVSIRAVSRQYALGSDVAVPLSMSSEIATTLHAKIYHVKENGDLLLMASAQITTDTYGKSAFAVGPPFGQWRAGRALLVVEPDLWPQMRETVDLSFVGVNAPQEIVHEPIKPANVVCDVSTNADVRLTVKPGERFLVRGWLEASDFKGSPLGPPVILDVIEPSINAAGMSQELTHQSGATFAVRAKDGRFGFELEVKAPEVAKNLLLRLKPAVGTIVDARKSPGTIERILSIKPEKPNP